MRRPPPPPPPPSTPPLHTSPISSCHPSNEYQLNCSVDLRSLDVNVICVSVADGGAQTNERRAWPDRVMSIKPIRPITAEWLTAPADRPTDRQTAQGGEAMHLAKQNGCQNSGGPLQNKMINIAAVAVRRHTRL